MNINEALNWTDNISICYEKDDFALKALAAEVRRLKQAADTIDSAPLTLPLASELQGLLIDTQLKLKALMFRYGVDAVSLHVCPDIMYAAFEHEEVCTGVVTRRPPACHELIVKV